MGNILRKVVHSHLKNISSNLFRQHAVQFSRRHYQKDKVAMLGFE
jgi:hypothetical protein